MNELAPIYLSLKLSLITTALLFVIGVPIAYLLSSSRAKFKPLLESLIALPLVLPPSVIGFYLLITFSPESTIGIFLIENFNFNLLFTFEGLVFASLLYSLSFMIHPIQSGFESLPISLKEAAYSLGVSKFRTFLYVLLPNIKPALLTGIVLTFAHTMGEFGVVLMIGGNIPGVTQVASIAIYEEVESLHYDRANQYSLLLIGISLLILIFLYTFNKKYVRRIW